MRMSPLALVFALAVLPAAPQDAARQGGTPQGGSRESGTRQSGAQPGRTTSTVDLGGKLYRSVFVAGTGMLAPADLPAIPEPLRSRLAEYLDRRKAFKSAYKGESDSLDAMRSDAKRRVLEHAIVALVPVEGVHAAAAGFVARAPIKPDWHAMHDGPLEEAAYAEDVLKADPSSILAPWIYVFIAQRQRAAFEAYQNEKNEDGMKACAKKYRTFVERARSVDDPVFAALVEDLERQPYLYIKGGMHPRDYAPDS
jgi:hypothetical protein